MRPATSPTARRVPLRSRRMTVAIASDDPDPLPAAFGAHLADVRRREGARILLLDACEPPPPDTGADVLINACACGADACCAALAAADVALVPLAPEAADAGRHYGLIARLNAARMRNPGLRVLFVAVCAGAAPDARALDAVRAYAREVMSAHVAHAVLDGAALRRGDGRIACVAELGREVFGQRP